MKYRLVKDLPFIKEGSIFGIGSWVGGGFGIDLGNAPHGAHNGVRTFEPFQNALLESLIDNKDWIEKIPTSLSEALSLHDKGLNVIPYLKFVDRP